MMKRTALITAFAATVGLTASLSALAASPTTLRVIVVQTADVPAYVHEINTLQAIFKKIGQQVTLRVWRATYAGPETGAVAVTVEVPNFMALAKLNETLQSNPEVAAEMKKIGGMRKIVSDSLYDQLTE
jgi:hypothetical protein